MNARSIRSEYAANVLLSAATPSHVSTDSARVNSDGSIEFAAAGVEVSPYRSSADYGFRNDVTSFRRISR